MVLAKRYEGLLMLSVSASGKGANLNDLPEHSLQVGDRGISWLLASAGQCLNPMTDRFDRPEMMCSFKLGCVPGKNQVNGLILKVMFCPGALWPFREALASSLKADVFVRIYRRSRR